MNSKYAKAFLALLISVATALVTALGTSPQQNLSHLHGGDWWKIAGAIAASGGFTWWAENVPGIAGGIIKGVSATLGAFITAIITAYADNIVTQGELIGAISAGAIALLAVYQVGNKGTNTQ